MRPITASLGFVLLGRGGGGTEGGEPGVRGIEAVSMISTSSALPLCTFGRGRSAKRERRRGGGWIELAEPDGDALAPDWLEAGVRAAGDVALAGVERAALEGRRGGGFTEADVRGLKCDSSEREG